MPIQKTLFSKSQIDQKVDEIASYINSDYKDEKEVYIVGVLKGSFIFVADLVRKIKVPIKIDFIRVKTYKGTKADQLPDKLYSEKDLEEFRGKNVIIVEDIIDKGQTAKFILDSFSQYSPKTLKICSLIYKTSAFPLVDKIDYVGFLVKKNDFIVGYGLDYDEDLRELENIEILIP